MVLDSRSDLKNTNIGKAKFISSNIGVGSTSNNAIAQWWQKLGLRTKATIISVVAATIPLTVVSMSVYFSVGKILTENTKESQLVRAVRMADKVERFIFERYADIQAIAELPILSNPKVRNIISQQEKKEVLESYIRINQVYDGIALYSLDGTLIFDVGAVRSPKNVSKRDYFLSALRTDKAYISQPEASAVTKKISIFFAAPVKDPSGETIAIVRSRMPVVALDRLVEDFGKNGNRYYISDASGRFFIASEKEQINGDAKTDFSGVANIIASRQPGVGDSVNRVSGNQQFVASAPLLSRAGVPDPQWDMIIGLDTSIALEAAQALLFQQILIIGGAITLVAAGAVLISRRATKPILEATAAVSELGKGNLDTRLQVQGQDEMAQLGQNINSMAGQLQDFLQLQEAQAKRSQMLAEVSRSSSVEELDAPLSRILEIARENIDCDRLVVYRFVANLKGIIVAEATVRNSTLTSSRTVGLSDPCIPADTIEAYKQGKVLATYDVFNAGFDPAHVELMRKLQIKSNLIVPILRGGEVDGLLIAHACEQQREWQTDEIDQLKDWAKDLGLALGGLATIEQQQAISARETERSETLQRELIGLLSDVEGATQGDLTVRAQITAGEIGIVADFFNAIVESLRDVVSQVKQATAKVNSSVSSNDIAIRGLSDDAKLQAQQLDDALQSVEKMTASIQEVAVNAKQASDASSTAADTAELGSQAIERSAESILQLRQTVAETAKKVKRLGEASQQISKVVVLIDQIALKTNMLAVNASIEAAKAGEEGRGFAVVAEEVGALAAQSTTATKEIERIVANIQRETSEVGEAMEASTEQVVAGTQQVELARKSLGQIVEVSRKVNELFQNISGATVSQVKTSEAVKILMENLATMSQKSSQTSRNVSEALQETVGVANQLQASVETFKVND